MYSYQVATTYRPIHTIVIQSLLYLYYACVSITGANYGLESIFYELAEIKLIH